jgi:hypothetical protein
VCGTRSDRFPPEAVTRFAAGFPHIPQKLVDAEHDVARMAPNAFIAHMSEFIGLG